MEIVTINDLKGYMKKYGLRLVDIAEMLNISVNTASAKMNSLSFTIKELQTISNFTNDSIIIKGV